MRTASRTCISLLLAAAMTMGYMPAFAVAEEYEDGVIAAEADGQESGDEQNGDNQLVGDSDDGENQNDKSGGIEVASDYDTFISDLKVLEGYAAEYASANNLNAVSLVLNYIRTGIKSYNTDSWATLAGAENTEFTAYVAEQDAQNNTEAQALRGIGSFVLPNGQEAEFSHMIGALSLAYYNTGSQASADFGSFVGDICDLMEYSNGKASGANVEELAADIYENYLGIDDPSAHSFGILDIRGDLDAYYILTKLATDGGSISAIAEGYFTPEMTDASRADEFLQNRFTSCGSKNTLRAAVLKAYQDNGGTALLEADRGLTGKDDLRTACCYAFADYLYDAVDGQLKGDDKDEPVNPDDPDDPEVPQDNPYYYVFSSTESTLAPGVQQVIKKATTADNKQIVFYVATVDVNRDDLTVCANYRNHDGSSWGMSRVLDQVSAAITKHTNPNDSANYIEGYTPIVATNGDFYNMTSGAPSGALVMNGVEYHGVANENFFAILDDGSAMIGGKAEYEVNRERIKEAIGGGAYLVRNGEIAVKSSTNYYNDRASRTCVGITADGKVVMMVLDGRQEPFSAGGSAEEIAQIMLDAGCVTAINLDGGGSTTYAAKVEGADTMTVVNRPSDGFSRSVSSSLMAVSTASGGNVFDHAVITTSEDYLTPGSALDVTLTGVNATGGPAEIPTGAELRVSDPSIISIDGDVVRAVSLGDAEIELVLGGSVVASKTIHVVVPDSLRFEKDVLNVVYGTEAALPLIATYQGNEVAINPDDVSFSLKNSSAGVINGFTFIGNEESGVRITRVTAYLKNDGSISTSMDIALYSNGEAIFDFNTADEGDRTLAWTRDVSNSVETDEKVYHVVDVNKPMDVSYIFALDMQAIEIPEKLTPIVSLLPGAGTDNGTAWHFLLQLAERVSVLTEVKIKLDVDPNMEIDYSDITFVNEYFELTDVTFDTESNTLTAYCHFIDQTQAIDAATANPICILSGIKMKPKADAAWDSNKSLTVINSGELSYDIYLRSSTLYGLCKDPAIQNEYGLYPFVNPDVIVSGGGKESGGHFCSTYASFDDTFVLNNAAKEGWYAENDRLYYYKDNKPVTGIQEVPGYKDEENLYYYDFDENGECRSKITGVFELDGDYYLANRGVLINGWYVNQNESGEDYYMYFDPTTMKAVDETQVIDGYTYVFENRMLVKGDLRQTDQGALYHWAGQRIYNRWLTIDGNQYYFNGKGYATPGVFQVYESYDRYIADDNGIWQSDYNGLYDWKNQTYYVEEGKIVPYPGLVKNGDDYYYFRSNDTAVKNRSYWVTKTNSLLPEGNYTFDEDGKMVNPPTVEPGPDEPGPVEPEVKNGVVAENGSLWYYVDGTITPAGLVKVGDDYYYAKTSTGEVVHGRKYWVSMTNGLLPVGEYAFDEDGKMAH